MMIDTGPRRDTNPLRGRMRFSIFLGIALANAWGSPVLGGDEALPAQATMRLGSLSLRMRKMPASITFSPDSKTLVTTEYEVGRVQFWDVATGNLKRELPPGTASRVVYRPDGKLFLTGHGYDSLHVWESATFAKKRKLVERGGHSMVFTADGKQLFTTIGLQPTPPDSWASAIALIDLETGKEIRRYAGFEKQPQVYLTLALSPDERLFACGDFSGPAGGDAKVIVWDKETGETLCQVIEPYHVQQICFSPDSKSLVIGGYERMSVIDARTGKLRHRFDKGTRNGVAFDPSGKWIVTAGDKAIWNFESGKEKLKLQSDIPYPGRDAAWSEDGNSMAISFHEPPYLAMWQADTGKRVLFGEGHRTPVDGITMSHDGTRIATASSRERKAFIWDAKTGKVGPSIHPRTDYYFLLDSFTFTKDDQGLVLGGTRWETATGKLQGFEKGPPDTSTMNQLVRSFVSPDSTLQAQRTWTEVIVRDGRTDKVQHVVKVEDAKNGVLNHAIYSPDGKYLVTAIMDNRVEDKGPVPDSIVFWDAKTGEKKHSFRPKRLTIRRLLFSEDGQYLFASTHPGRIEVWHIDTGVLRQDIEVPWDYREELTTFAIAPHGQLLAVQEQQDGIHLYEVTTGKLVHKLMGAYTRANSLAFSRDGRTLLSGHADGTALVWDVVDFKKRQGKDEFGENDWKALADQPNVAHGVVWELAANPKEALALLKAKLKPAPVIDEATVKQLVKDLGDANFRKRENATVELLKLNVISAPILREALKAGPPLETQRRIEKLLAVVDTNIPPADVLRDMRAIQALETIGSDEALTLLTELTKGTHLHPKTKAARLAIARLQVYK